jgi:hypothetical protein
MGTSRSCPAVLNFDRVRLMVPPKRERHSKEWWHMYHAIDGDGFASPSTFVGSGVRSRPPRILRQRHDRTEKAHRAAPSDLKFEDQLLNECGAMRYASTKGMEIPPRAASIVRRLDNQRLGAGVGWLPQPQDASELSSAHRSLTSTSDPGALPVTALSFWAPVAGFFADPASWRVSAPALRPVPVQPYRDTRGRFTSRPRDARGRFVEVA